VLFFTGIKNERQRNDKVNFSFNKLILTILEFNTLDVIIYAGNNFTEFPQNFVESNRNTCEKNCTNFIRDNINPRNT